MTIFRRIQFRASWLGDFFNRSRVQRHYRKDLPPIEYGVKTLIVVEGLWDNPNHWLRLWMVLHALLRNQEADVVGVLRSRNNLDNWNKRLSLEALGVRRFLYIEDAMPLAAYEKQAETLMAGIKTSREFLGMALPEGLPAYTVLDTVLKNARNPQPEFENNPIWQKTLAESLRFSDFFRRFLDGHSVAAVVSSHAWKNEYATLCWSALTRGIPFYYLTAHYNSIRVRCMTKVDDYQLPNEHLAFEDYQGLSAAHRTALIEWGRAYLKERFSGDSDFIIIRYAMRPENRHGDRASLLRGMRLDPDKPLGVIYAHSWYDFPHTQAMTNFTDPLDWIRFTLKTVMPLTGVNWAFKAHPCDRWYGTIRLEDLLGGLPEHIALVPEDSDSLAVQTAADAVVTIQGTIAVEASAMGKRALCADKGMYTPWGFAHTATSREDYATKLQNIFNLSIPSQDQSERAMAYIATAIAPPPKGAEWLKLSCDTLFLEKALYPKVRRMLWQNDGAIKAEVAKLAQWAASKPHSYNVWRILNILKNNKE